METDRSAICGCKGIRTCLQCEKLFGIENKYDSNFYRRGYKPYFYCVDCDASWPGWDCQSHTAHEGEPLQVEGVYVLPDFISEREETELLSSLDALPWDTSQSGRRKQNFGPKCNFKKRRFRIGDFKGFPLSTKFVQNKFQTVPLLQDFSTIEQCTLEYDPSKGASIDPHIDDCWIWGERIVTVNLLSDSILTLTNYEVPEDKAKYNLFLAPDTKNPEISGENVVVRLPMPRRSLMVLWGEARYRWEHQIFREDITTRRVCLAYREFTPPYLSGGQHADEGNQFLRIARESWL